MLQKFTVPNIQVGISTSTLICKIAVMNDGRGYMARIILSAGVWEKRDGTPLEFESFHQTG